MCRRVLVAVVGLAVVVVGGGRVPEAAAQAPTTCFAEVAGARFDDRAPFAGRVRPFATSPTDPTIERRSLTCPYVASDGTTLQLDLEWNVVSGDRFACTNQELRPEGDDPASATIDHPDLQGAVLLQAPDAATVRAMEQAARLSLSAVPASTPACGEPPVVASGTGTGWTGRLPIVAVGGSVLALVAVLARRRRAQPAVEAAGPVDRADLLDAELARTDEELGRVDEAIRAGGGRPSATPGVARVLDRLSAASGAGTLDVATMTAAVAHARGRPDLARMTLTSRRALHDGRRHRPGDPVDRLHERILDLSRVPADGTMAGLLDARTRLIDTRRLLMQRRTAERTAP